VTYELLTEGQGEREGGGFVHVGTVMAEVLKEISRRAELRPRLEVELGRHLTDEEFLVIAEQSGVRV